MAFKIPDSTKKVKSNLNNLVKIKQAQLTITEGRKIKLSEMNEIIATDCNVSPHTIKQFRQHLSVPSLEVALKLSNYFGCTINDIYSLNEVQ